MSPIAEFGTAAGCLGWKPDPTTMQCSVHCNKTSARSPALSCYSVAPTVLMGLLLQVERLIIVASADFFQLLVRSNICRLYSLWLAIRVRQRNVWRACNAISNNVLIYVIHRTFYVPTAAQLPRTILRHTIALHVYVRRSTNNNQRRTSNFEGILLHIVGHKLVVLVLNA